MTITAISKDLPIQAAPEPIQMSVIYRILAVVATCLAQQNESARNKRSEINQQKAEHKLLSQSSADLTRSIGWDGVKFMVLTVAASGLLLSPHDSDHQFSRVFQDMVPKVEGLFTSSKRSQQQRLDSQAQMISTMISGDINNESSDSSAKEKATQLAQAATEGWRVARNG